MKTLPHPSRLQVVPGVTITSKSSSSSTIGAEATDGVAIFWFWERVVGADAPAVEYVSVPSLLFVTVVVDGDLDTDTSVVWAV